MGLTGPSAQYQYTSPHMVPDSSIALLRAGYANGVRPDALVVKMPPPPPIDSMDRSDFVSGFSRAAAGLWLCQSSFRVCGERAGRELLLHQPAGVVCHGLSD